MCVAYDVDGVRHDEMPVNQSDFHHAVPIYEELPGWWEDISGARTLDDLPPNARAYVQAVEEMSGARISAVGRRPGARPDRRRARPALTCPCCRRVSRSPRGVSRFVAWTRPVVGS